VSKSFRATQAIDDKVIWHMHFACWIAEVTNKHSEYVILAAFPWQQWLCECTLMLCYVYIFCLVHFLLSLLMHCDRLCSIQVALKLIMPKLSES
jgi:hypothetical protein